MDATIMPYFLSASSPPTESLARVSRLLLHGRDYRRYWLWPLTERRLSVDSVAHLSCFADGSSAAGVRVGDGG